MEARREWSSEIERDIEKIGKESYFDHCDLVREISDYKGESSGE